MLKRLPVAPFIGLVIGLLGAAGIWRGSPLLIRSMVGVSDDWMLSDRGPRLGMRSAEPEIAFVNFGQSSAVRLRSKPTPALDAKLYRELLDAGATVVMDNRVLVSGTVEAFESEIRPYLDAMAEMPGAEGRLARDFVIGLDVDLARIEPLMPFIRHNAVNMRSPRAPMLHSRIYPLVNRDFFALEETAALWIARRHRGQAAATTERIQAELSLSGLRDAWVAQAPGMAPLVTAAATTAEGELDSIATLRKPYALGDTPVRWLPFDCSYVTVAPGGFWIDYSVDTKSYPRLEYGDVVEGDFDAELVRGKVVLVGLSIDYVPVGERFSAPQRFEQASEDEVLAAAVQTLLDDRTLREIPPWATFSLTVVGSVFAAIAVSLRRIWIALAGVAAIFALYYVAAIVAFRNCWFVDLVWTPSVMLTAATAGVGHRFASEVRSRRRITDMFGRYVPRAVVEQLVRRPELQQIMLTGSKHIVTVMFADIRGFTAYSEQHPPDTVLERLNQLLEVMVECTFAEQGTVDKFIGDAILVLFNAPTEQPDHVQRALRTACEIQSRLSSHAAGLLVGIGIHTGEAVVGNIGAAQRMEYTAIGSTVNLASRLCDYAKAGEIICSDSVVEDAGAVCEFEPLSAIRVKGVGREVAIQRVVCCE
ncbi:MAG: adenylate/guanylate cyclase domain-containing protein [Planctomycetales bacterium]|nr:adenylate/guanylate cyclase domain-containing protein [Planctomycetales bacterium]